MFTGNNISVAINYAITYNISACTAVCIDQSNHFFSVDSRVSNLIGCPRCKIIGEIDIGTKLSILLIGKSI